MTRDLKWSDHRRYKNKAEDKFATVFSLIKNGHFEDLFPDVGFLHQRDIVLRVVNVYFKIVVKRIICDREMILLPKDAGYLKMFSKRKKSEFSLNYDPEIGRMVKKMKGTTHFHEVVWINKPRQSRVSYTRRWFSLVKEAVNKNGLYEIFNPNMIENAKPPSEYRASV